MTGMGETKRMGLATGRSVIVLMIAVFGLVGCSKEEGATPIGRGARAITPSGQTPSSAGISLNGWVIADASHQDLFQHSLSGFVEASMDSAYLGYVSAQATGGTGVFLGGSVELQAGLLNPSNTTQVNIKTDSKLLVTIYDEFTGRPDSTGATVSPISTYLTTASGYVQGNRAYLKFSDSYGMIELDGTFNANVFEGTFSYDNNRRFDGAGQGAEGVLGTFQVPTCQFFRCQ
ncbi:MAG: hypothetical protein RBT63_10175 [Bdellovibrionales bacterium]|jgi:hypothetical protein|nr:hypothetical protein [Bdellovibrionales bacterium]